MKVDRLSARYSDFRRSAMFYAAILGACLGITGKGGGVMCRARVTRRASRLYQLRVSFFFPGGSGGGGGGGDAGEGGYVSDVNAPPQLKLCEVVSSPLLFPSSSSL